MSICVISQPRFFPGLHYLHRMMAADVFVIFDTVQFNPRHEENRAKFGTPRGVEWLTVPMQRKSRDQTIRDTRIDNAQDWRRRAAQTLQHLYGKAPFYDGHAPAIRSILEAPHETLTDLDWASWEPALRLLGINCQFVRASELKTSGNGPGLLLNICKHLGADVYLSGQFGREYLDTAAFAAEGVNVVFHEYQCGAYRQRQSGFTPFLSYLDMLFNVGLERDTVWAGRRTLIPA